MLHMGAFWREDFMDTTYSLNTHNICPDTLQPLNVHVEIKSSEFVSVYDLLDEIKRLKAEPIRRPEFTRKLGEFFRARCGRGSIRSTWSDYDAVVSDFEISCAIEWNTGEQEGATRT
jgi:hypothetical protein